MLNSIVDRRDVRIIIGIIGIPITLIVMFSMIYGFIFLLSGELIGFSLGFASFLGALGTYGAWLRILKPITCREEKSKKLIRLFLLFGITATVIVSWVSLSGGLYDIAAFFMLATVGGILLVLSTK